MPRLTYTPEGSESPKQWDINFGRMMLAERMAIEKLTGLGWNAVQGHFWGNQAVVIHAFLWVLLKRDLPGLRADQVEFIDDEIDVDLTDDEAREALKKIKAQDVLADDDLEALAELEKRLGGDLASEEEAADAGPKAGLTVA